MDNLDFSLKQRKDFLKCNDLEKCMKEFKEKKEQSSAKLKKIKTVQPEKEQEEEYKPSPLGKQVNKKKKKDVITLDLPMMGMIQPAPQKETNESIFGKTFNENNTENNLKETIDKETGLPKAFLVKDMKINSKKETSAIEETMNLKEEKSKEKNEYSNQIDKENKEKIGKMSFKEIEEYQKEIALQIPSSLIAKLKAGKLHDKLQKELARLDKAALTEQSNANDINDKNKDTINPKAEIVHKDNNNEIFIPMPYYNSLGNKQIKNVPETLSAKETSNIIDFSHNTFNEMESDKKYFSLLEIYNLLCSSNDNQIVFSLKLLYKIIPIDFDQEPELQRQLFSFINGIFYLIDYRNINVRFESLRLFAMILDIFYRKDLKVFLEGLLCQSSSFPLQIIYTLPIGNTNNDSSSLTETKTRLTQLLKENSTKDIIKLMEHNSNKDINMLYSEIVLYLYYLNGKEKIRRDYKRILTNDILKYDNKHMTLVLLYSSQEECKDNQMKKACYDEAKTDKMKLIYLYMTLLKEEKNILLTEEVSFLLKKDFSSMKCKIIQMNCLLKLGQYIPSDYYLGETDYILLSNTLQALLKHSSLNDNCPMFTNDSILNFFIGKYHEAIASLSSTSSSCAPYEDLKIPIYTYFNSIFLLYMKGFKYPQVINYYKSINLKDIMNLFPILMKELSSITSTIQSHRNEKEKKCQYLHQYEPLLHASLNFIHCFIKRHEPEYNQLNLAEMFIQLSKLINLNSEYFYYKYIKYFKIYFYKKYTMIQGETFFPFIEYKTIDEDLNFYLNSNEDLRKSTMYKKMMIMQTDSSIVNELVMDEGYYGDLTKYFPFENNFLFQVLYNKGAKTDLKVNYMVITIILLNNELLSVDNKELFELYLRTLVFFKSSDFTMIPYADVVFEKYAQLILLSPDMKCEYYLRAMENNQSLLENYFDTFDSIHVINELKPYIKSVIMMIMYLHASKEKGEGKKKNIKGYQYCKNVSYIIYQHFNYLIKREFSYEFIYGKEDDGMMNRLIIILIEKMHICYIELYETIIMSYLRYINQNKENDKNNTMSIIGYYAKELLNHFSIKHDDYSKFMNNTSLLKEMIKNKLVILP